MKKFISFILILISSCFIFGCQSSDDKIDIIAVSFSDYEFTKAVVGNLDYYNVHYLLKDGQDGHSYQATFKDKMLFSKAKMVVYSGGDSTSWIDGLIMSDCKKVKYIEFLLPICLDAHDTGEHHNHLVDEHYSLSIKNAIIITNKIMEELSQIDQMHSRIFAENGYLYINRLQQLDSEYESLKTGENHYVIVADRQPFSYLFNDYDINCFSAIKGCSTEIDCSFSTIVGLANKLNEYSLTNILVTENGSLDIANSVIKQSGKQNIQILRLNSMQSIKANSNTSYIEICNQNLNVLKTCLGVNNG